MNHHPTPRTRKLAAKLVAEILATDHAVELENTSVNRLAVKELAAQGRRVEKKEGIFIVYAT